MTSSCKYLIFDEWNESFYATQAFKVLDIIQENFSTILEKCKVFLH